MSEPAPTGLVLGPLEVEIMNVLWSAPAPVSVRDVLDALNGTRGTPLAYTTVMTVLSRLADKGAAARTKEGRGYAYTAAVADEAALAVREVIRGFGAAAVAHFVDEARNAPDLMARLERLMQEGDRK
ncbi:BlaI/MecI/CopY family transcriptional regulator [Streptomyces sp. So13.3]|uniref:BlaI/MecI/CopY family transcriptional regulator n=1 Tax=Streptomyces TaxID=1883 RepID=UPI001107270E|nr:MULTISPECIES: BlaI/MecI/CopY family transcriptional regulator [unclassified Streptomyces]MCZ4101609.1 BlaI/MecI/CopY family transcriptional regulator [Streptomyces sp. H39-C1]QNA76360.1 BlaI/MecI/CopY family transcriptional regulator [Streptomyces sp. So13.3]